MHNKLNKKLKDIVVPALVNGEHQTAIAKKVNVHQSTISRWKQQLSDQLEQFQLQLIDQAGQETISNITTTIRRANSVLHNPNISHKDLSDYKTLLELSHRKEHLIGQSMQIYPVPDKSTTIINNITNHDNRTILTPTMAALMQGQAAEQDIEDCEYEEIEE